MFSCVICKKVYVHKHELNRHAKAHDGSVNSCGICFKVLSRKDKLSSHVQNVHNYHVSVIRWAPPTTPQNANSATPHPIVTATRSNAYRPPATSATLDRSNTLPPTQQCATHAENNKKKIDWKKYAGYLENVIAWNCDPAIPYDYYWNNEKIDASDDDIGTIMDRNIDDEINTTTSSSGLSTVITSASQQVEYIFNINVDDTDSDDH
ncbi:uncharacterized protein LOC132922871 isoform X2 [Rhopalosiphum padi]|uniref:uncharacterized protein LOC132922871 isoform X2 n=1 Tax=Rhopalosiphum padi TaxID=40932 RepID=UPI00298E1DB7|nr:uncharacterized protein LOC132922871 isoform X2 [Rhopalosiphum padi]